MFRLGNSWDDVLGEEFTQPYYLQLRKFLKEEYFSGKTPIYPPMDDIFNAFRATDYNAVKVVLLGQDPYHGEGQAHGFCFSVRDGVRPPPSLQNMFKELESDLGFPRPQSGSLLRWAENGVLLLNSVLTVRAGQPGSHTGKGWEHFTDRAIIKLNERQEPVCFLLWGVYAKKKAELVTNSAHLVLTAAHPSPLSAHNGFFGCKHFSRCNEFLPKPVDWRLDS